ncbi:hypothetical protein HELRODRAFT_189999 [Helobdella robusta]|uniref:Glutamine amidotransferase type-2 domain-containing protein n=1 Tax=Helobdella robusta TaxID=6412 RepID=T1FRK8_HELRO|nr:hypothetical protein HELRODRAFT_189999 [Helobdella robusta]ESO11561.1 hypothetical protein HELRODRAFT_189999 [Helobdella robusta]
MCGIFVLIENKSKVCDCHPSTTIKDQILSRLNRRGPDVIAEKFIELSDEYQATFIGSTLHLRGTEIQEQPLSNEDGDLLLWNGEIFGGIQVSETENDGNILMKKLTDCKSECETLNLFASIKGPYAFVYWQAKNKKLWIARDILGRRSLLINTTADNNYHNNGCVNIKDPSPSSSSSSCKIHLFPWLWKPQINENHNDGTDTEMILTTTTTTYNSGFHDKYFNYTPESKNCFSNNFPCHLSNYGLFCHLSKFKHFGKLSGEGILKNDDGNSKYVHAVLSNTNQRQHQQKQHRQKQHQRTQQKQQQNHHNHCNDFSSFVTDERVKAMRDFLKLLGSSVEKRTSAESVCSCCNFCMQKMLENKCCSNSLINNLKNSMTFSAPTSSSFPTSVASSSSLMTSSSSPLVICHHSKVAILFSGGLDSLVLALLANRYIQRSDPIDLLNVSFFNHSKEKSIKHLIHPLDTVLDDSIGCALWFAARGQGRLKLGQANVVCQGQGHVSNGNQLEDGNYVSPARVVLSGLGADELLAGYSRHRMKFGPDENWELLGDELEREITNLWNRNLGRDDRIISDHCREARFPYLDEDLVDFILSLDMHLKFDLRAPRGVGDKLLLRMAAQDLNLHKGSLLQKRAIQFGSRIAKLEGRKEKASEVCARLVSDAEIS